MSEVQRIAQNSNGTPSRVVKMAAIASDCKRLSEGDLDRVQGLIESLLEQKSGKGKKKSQGMAKRLPDHQENWRIGN